MIALRLLFEDARADDQIGDFALFAHLPVDELFDVGVVGVEHDHLGGAARRAAGLDCAGGAIENLEKRHEAARRAAAGQLLAGRAKLRKVCAAAAAALKDARFANDAVENAAFVYEIVVDPEDVSTRRPEGERTYRATPSQSPSAAIDETMTLRRTGDAVRPMQSGIEPLR